MSRNPFIGSLSSFFVWLWWHLPFSRENKEQIKAVLFHCLGFVFRRTRAYRNWRDSQMLKKYKRLDDLTVFPPHWPFDQAESSFNAANRPLKTENLPEIKTLAVLLHVHYPQLLKEVLKLLLQSHLVPYRLYVSASEEVAKEVRGILKETRLNCCFRSTENRGRDVRPFLHMASIALDDGHELLVKIHTKKSDHRLTGDLWRRELYKKLLGSRIMGRAVEAFSTCSKIGLMGPAGHIVPMKTYYGANAKALGYLGLRMGMPPNQILNLNFIAGSMFYIRKQALMPLLELQLSSDIFEHENGQQDGTMAHALERAFAISNYLAGLKLVDTNYREGSPDFSLTKEHPYTW